MDEFWSNERDGGRIDSLRGRVIDIARLSGNGRGKGSQADVAGRVRTARAVDMSVDHTGHDSCSREVDHVRARRNGKARADFRNAIASHDHYLTGEHRARTCVE